ncbi:hypothetical protein AXG93_3671s1240 [Marchantia polymorpha subsp. ruderalis]|uniref:Uncharacterized protein n=1 Tax=Marchantia polymorpha subsp. ruderalis TaxID=1480154 RepID=A0A176WJ87_MARPO|nr:hypothetical protein AXG93_3671s1240 [Marchantia polymorpha subsp. ruderalis]
MTLKSKRLPEEHHEDWFEWRWSLWSELQLAKRQKIAGASEAARRPKARMTGSDVTCLRTPKTRARPKKKSHCRVIKSKSSKCSVAMIEGAAYATDEDTMEEVDLLTTELEPLGVQSEKPLEDSVIHLLKHLDGKREYAMSKEAVFYIDMLMNSTHIKRAATMKTAKEMTREGAEATTSLEVREEQFRAKDME